MLYFNLVHVNEQKHSFRPIALIKSFITQQLLASQDTGYILNTNTRGQSVYNEMCMDNWNYMPHNHMRI